MGYSKDILLVACGGRAKRMLMQTPVSGIVDHVTVGLDGDMVEAAFCDASGISGGMTSDWDDVLDSIGRRMAGCRIVMPFAVIGDESGGEIPLGVISRAHACGCKVVSVLAKPYAFESDHRNRADALFPRITEASDRSVVMDLEVLMEKQPEKGNLKLDSALKAYSRIVSRGICCILEALDGPFFSTFVEKCYTFSYVTDTSIMSAVDRSKQLFLFNTDITEGKPVITVGSGVLEMEVEPAADHVVSYTGSVPDVLWREDDEDTRVIVFHPVRI